MSALDYREKSRTRGGFSLAVFLKVTSSPWLITNNRDASNGACNSGGNTGANNSAYANNGVYADNGVYANNGDGAYNAFDNNGSFRRRLWGRVSPGSAQMAPR